MLRKAGTVMLVLFYLVITTGFTLNAHYCGGKMVEVKVFSKPDHCCTKAKSCHQEDTKCCDDESFVIQLEQWQLASTLPSYEISWIALPIIPPAFEFVLANTPNDLEFGIDIPPPKPSSLWLLYHRLTLYG